MNRIEKYFLIAALIATLAACAKTMPASLPKAIDWELANQRRIAAKSYRHLPGVYEYQNFVSNQEGNR